MPPRRPKADGRRQAIAAAKAAAKKLIINQFLLPYYSLCLGTKHAQNAKYLLLNPKTPYYADPPPHGPPRQAPRDGPAQHPARPRDTDASSFLSLSRIVFSSFCV